MFKKIIALVLGASIFTSVASAAMFSDTLGHWAETDIQYGVDNGIVNGYNDGTFKPNAEITRAEFTKMMIASFCENLEIDLTEFDDGSHWAAKYNNFAAENLFYIDKTVTYDDVSPALLEGENYNYPIRRWEIAYMLCSTLVNAYGIDRMDAEYTDKNQTYLTYGELIEAAISTCIGVGILQGDENANFNAQKKATRAEAVTIVSRLDRFTKKVLEEIARQQEEEKELEEIENSKVKEYTEIPEGNPKVMMELSDGGKFIIELYPEFAPQTVANFVSLVEEGFYDGLTFHRVIEGFVAQGGDPNGDGTGGAEHNILGEFITNGFVDNTLKHERGVVSMARSKFNNSASSQFFICFDAQPNLDGQYAAFGKVIEGMDVVDAMAKVELLDDGFGEASKPKEDIIIKKATIVK